jgi:HAD superfamily hydrolase (TIGR01549 family)
MVKAVFFDFYNTLGVWGRSLKPRVQEIAARYGIEIDLERYAAARENLYSDASGSDPATHDLLENMQQIIDSYRDFLSELGVQNYLDQVTWELLQSEHSLFAATNAILYEDTVPTLEHLRGEGFKLAIVSNWDTPLDPLTERLGIAHYFDIIVASHDTRVRSAKPDSHIFNYTLEAVGVLASEAVHVGDTYEADVIGARRACIHPIFIDRDSSQVSRWNRVVTIQSLSELPALLSERDWRV